MAGQIAVHGRDERLRPCEDLQRLLWLDRPHGSVVLLLPRGDGPHGLVHQTETPSSRMVLMKRDAAAGPCSRSSLESTRGAITTSGNPASQATSATSLRTPASTRSSTTSTSMSDSSTASPRARDPNTSTRSTGSRARTCVANLLALVLSAGAIMARASSTYRVELAREGPCGPKGRDRTSACRPTGGSGGPGRRCAGGFKGVWGGTAAGHVGPWA